MKKTSTAGPGEARVTVMFGRAVEDLPDDSAVLKVVIANLLPGQEGGVAPAETGATTTARTDVGVSTSSAATMANFIEAIYFGATNEKYPPSIRKGEQVRITQFGDSDRFLWEGLGRNSDLRTVDVRRIEVAAKPEPQSLLTDDNTYHLELNSKKKFVQIKTSMVNEEMTRYLLKLDAEKGEVTLTDHLQNVFYMNTERKEVMLSTASGATLRAIDEDVVIAAPRDVTIQAGRNFIRKVGEMVADEIGTSVMRTVGENVEEEIGGGTTTKIGSDAVTEIGGGVNEKAGSGFNFNGAVHRVRIP